MCFLDYTGFRHRFCTILIIAYTAGGNAVGPYEDHFCMDQIVGKKVKF
jgi:hypothetical protein